MKILKLLLVIILAFLSADTLAQLKPELKPEPQANTELKSCNSLNEFHWLLGDWVADNGKSVTIESWQQVSPHTFEGFGESNLKSSNKRQSVELLRLVEMNNEIFYIAKPQQNKHPVGFKLTQCTNKNAVFENPDHDFPKKLNYRLMTHNQIQVIVSGDKGQSFSILFIKHNDN